MVSPSSSKPLYVLALSLWFNLLSSSELLRLRIRVLRFLFRVNDKGFKAGR